MSSTAPSSGRAWLHAALCALTAVATVTVVPLDPWRPAAEVAVFALGLAGVRCAVHRHRTPLARAWRLLGLGLLLFAVSSVAEVLQRLGVVPQVTAWLERAFDLAAYASLVGAALRAATRGRLRRDRGAWTDTATLLVAAGLALLAVGSSSTVGLADLQVGIGAPVVTVLLVVVCVPLAASASARSVTTVAVLVAAALAVVGYGGRVLLDDPLQGGPLLDSLPLLAVAALTLAGRHPSVATMRGRPHEDHGDAGGRVLGLGAALLVSPALVVLWTMGQGGNGPLLGAGTALLTALVLWRLTALNRERERTRTALAASESRLALMLDNAADVIAVVDVDGVITYMNPAVRSLLGRPPQDYLGVQAIELADPRDRSRLLAAVAAAGEASPAGAAADAGRFVDTDVRLQHSSGGTRWVELRVSGKVDAAGIAGWVVNLREVTDRKLFEEELRRQATTDPLTGLLNRSAFSDRLAQATVDVDPAAPPAVLFVDVDDFKSVNDSLGHAAGDELLTTVAARLCADVRAGDVIARLGGDEFAVLLARADGDLLTEVADRVLASLRAPMAIAGTTVAITASVGAALGSPGDTAERLLHDADTAMYSAKRNGKDARRLHVHRTTAPV